MFKLLKPCKMVFPIKHAKILFFLFLSGFAGFFPQLMMDLMCEFIV